jgi:hypothetical protein
MNQRVRGRIIAAVVSVGFAAGLLASGGSIVLVNAISAPAKSGPAHETE